MVSATNVIPYPGALPLLPPAKEECNVTTVTLLLSIRFHLCRQACSDNCYTLSANSHMLLCNYMVTTGCMYLTLHQ